MYSFFTEKRLEVEQKIVSMFQKEGYYIYLLKWVLGDQTEKLK